MRTTGDALQQAEAWQLRRMARPTRRMAPVAVLLLVTVMGCAPGGESAAQFERSPSEGAPPPVDSGSGISFASLSLEEALQRAGSERKLVMVDLYADWCGWCKKLDREVFSDSRVAGAASRIVSIRLDTEKEDGGKVAERFGIQGLPTVLFLTPTGRLVKRVDGFVPVGEMLRILRSLPESA